jgi:acetolactate synthase-1/2/3 large subunit
LVLGARLGEMTTGGYAMLTPPQTKQRLIHIHTNSDEIGRVYVVDRGLCCDPKAFLKTALDLVQGPLTSPPTAERASYEGWQTPFATPGDVKLEQVITHLCSVMPEDAIITNGAGNYAAWLHRYYRYKSYRTQLAPTSGSMGYGLPAAVAAKLERPEQEVVCLAGDGCFQMCMQEFGTAVQYGANIIVIVSNNGVYGTIRMHQQRYYPNRPSGTDMVNPDFTALAAAYGAHGEKVIRSADFPEALTRARASGKPAIIELKTDPAAVSHRTPA